jgi:sulfatase modifying factor 1
MAWTPVGNPGNACAPQLPGCFGAVSYAYNIGTYDVTNAQYAEFLNAKAASDPLGLYTTNMGSPGPGTGNLGGITRSGSSGSYTYSTTAGSANIPVNDVPFYDALRFANWMNNGQGNGSTETGAYTLLGGTAKPSNGLTVTRNSGANIVLTSEDEWYKAAYYDASSSKYFSYPTGSNTQTLCEPSPTSTPNTANCNNGVSDLTPVGSFTRSASPYGAFDMGGNVYQWNEAIINGADGLKRAIRGGWSDSAPSELAAFSRFSRDPSTDNPGIIGFRVAMVPEPGTGVLVNAGLLGLAGWRSERA